MAYTDLNGVLIYNAQTEFQELLIRILVLLYYRAKVNDSVRISVDKYVPNEGNFADSVVEVETKDTFKCVFSFFSVASASSTKPHIKVTVYRGVEVVYESVFEFPLMNRDSVSERTVKVRDLMNLFTQLYVARLRVKQQEGLMAFFNALSRL